MTEAPRIENLRQLEMLCEHDADCEFWRCIVIGAARDMGTGNYWPHEDRPEWLQLLQAIRWRRAEYMDDHSFTASPAPMEEREDALEAADQRIVDEINLYLQRLFGRNLMTTATAKPSASRRPKTNGHSHGGTQSAVLHPACTSTTTPAGIAALDPDATSFGQLKRAGKSRVAAVTTAAAVYGEEIVKVPLAELLDSPYQQRDEHSEEWLEELADSMRQFGQTNPALVREMPDGTKRLIAGHTRKLVAKRLKWLTLDCRLVTCDDSTEEELVLIENAKRKNLNAREKCRSYAALVVRYKAANRPQVELAARLGIKEATLSNTVRLQSLTDELWAMYEADELSIDQARALSTWSMYPLFVKAFLGHRKNIGITSGRIEERHFETCYQQGIGSASRPMKKDQYGGGCLFKWTDADKQDLDVQTVTRYGQKEERAFNVAAWNKRNKAAKEKQKEHKQAQQSGGSPSISSRAANEAAEEAGRKHQRQWAIDQTWREAKAFAIANRFGNKLNRKDREPLVRLAVIASKISGFDGLDINNNDIVGDEARFTEWCQKAVYDFFTSDMCCSELEDSDLDTFTEWLQIDPVESWRPSEDLLNTCSPDELASLVNLHTSRLSYKPGETTLDDIMREWKRGSVPDEFTQTQAKKPARKTKR